MNAPVATPTLRDYSLSPATASLVIAVSIATGVALAMAPILALFPIAALVSALLLVDGRARILFVVFGGLLILQRGENLDMSKMGFLAIFALAFVGAFLNVRGMRDTPAYRLARPLLTASIAFAALIALSLVVSHHNAIPPVGGWLRDVAPYALFASAPIFALDARASLSRRGLVTLLLAAGLFATLSFAVEWLQRRGIADFEVARVGLPSLFLPAALFAYGMSAVLQEKRGKWLVPAALVLALLLVTGSRTVVLLLIGPLAIVLATRRDRATRSVRLALLAPIAVAGTLVLGAVALSLFNADRELLQERIALVRSTGATSDASYVERGRQTRVAWEVGTSNVVLGSGPGTIFEYETIDGRPFSSFTIDTPLSFFAKFGLVGVAILAFVVAMYWSFTRAVVRRGGVTVEFLALVGFLGIVLASGLLFTPLEDKGFTFGLIPLLALALSAPERHHVPSEALARRT